MAQKQIEKLLSSTLKHYLQQKSAEMPKDFQIELSVTKDPSHGDFATNVAMRIARIIGSKPQDIAKELSPVLLKNSDFLEKIEIAGPGFLNFYLKKASLGKVIVDVFQKKSKYGQSDFGKNKKVLIEFVSANPTGPLTIAHGRQAAVGDSLARILKKTGHEVATEYYLNDAGRQMGLLGKSVWARYCQKLELEVELPEEGYQGSYIGDIAQKLIAEEADTLLKKQEADAVAFCSDYAGKTMMAQIESDLEKFRVHFDRFFSESTLYKKDLVNKALERINQEGYLYKKEGALWFKSSEFGDDKDRVVQKSTGEFTYLAPDIAYHHDKFQRGYNWIIDFMGPDHHGYIVRLKSACKALGHNPDALDIRIAQLSTLFREGKPVRMSTRAGEFVTLSELMEEVGVDATRYFFIMRRLESPLDFDLDLAKEKSQENPVYYLQYAHARIAGILRMSEFELCKDVNLELLSSEEEVNLIKFISDYENVLIQASEMMEPYRLADYLKGLATYYHKFYAHHKVLNPENEEMSRARLLLSEATRIVLHDGLELLGISQPESM